MKRFASFLIGAVVGYTVGMGLGLLLAPYSGEQFRRQVVDYKDHVAADVRKAVEEKQEQLQRELVLRRTPGMHLPG